MKQIQILNIDSTRVNTDLFNITAVNKPTNDPYWLEFIKGGLLEAGVETKILPLSDINKSKKWFINLDVLQHNWYDYDGDFFKSIDPDIKYELTHGNAYIILNHQCESFTHSFFKILYKNLKNYKSIPYNKIIYMVASINAKDEYKKFVIENKILESNRIEIMYAHHIYKRFSRGTNLNFFKYEKVKKQKKFLSLNRICRDHRLLMTSYLAGLDLLKHGYVSLGLHSDEAEHSHNVIKNLSVTYNLEKHLVTGFESFKNNLPLKVDNVDLKINQFQHDSLPIEYYQNTCFSLVSSTHALLGHEPSTGITEKEIKPMLAKHPFVIHNRPGILRELRNQGFLTFSKWFDESYDLEENDFVRLKMIAYEVKRLCEMSFEQWEIMLDEMEPILNHNYNLLVNHTNHHCFYNSDLKNFLYYAS